MRSSSAAPQRVRGWRLKKTLARRVEARPIESGDIKHIWAAYRLGALAVIYEGTGMEPAAFREAFERDVLTNYHAAWTMLAATREGFVPVGLMLGRWHPIPDMMVVMGAAWFPWASTRNILEATVNFLNEARKEMTMVFYVRPEHKKLYEAIAQHGIIRRIGTTGNAFPDAPAALFETRAA